LKEVARAEMEVLMCLEKGVRDLDEEKMEVIVEGYERSFEEWLRVEREKERRKAIKKQLEAMKARKIGRGL
jgi:UDP-N-acetylmuramyl tripeptide synthase